MYKKLIETRKKKKYTIKDLGDVINKSPVNYYKKEMGTVKLTIDEVEKICEFLNVEPTIFFKNEK